MAMTNPAQRFAQNHGRPDIAATARPGRFNEPGVVRMNAHGDAYAMHATVREPGMHGPAVHDPGFRNPGMRGPAEHAPRPHAEEHGRAPHEDRRPPHRR
jgi:hypothetical protein